MKNKISNLILRSGLLIGIALAVTWTMGTAWIGVQPTWPGSIAVGAMTLIVACLSHAVGGQMLDRYDAAGMCRLGRLLLMLLLAAGGAYGVLWTCFTHPVTAYGHRVVGSWDYSHLAKTYAATQPLPLSAVELLADMENNPDLVFEAKSLAAMRFTMLAVWQLTTAAILLWLTVLQRWAALPTSTAPDSIVASLTARLAAWPPGASDKWRIELERALLTLQQADNAPGAILTVAGMLEGERGLLGELGRNGQERLQGFNLLTQIEDLAKRGTLPGEVASDCHWIRLRANMARHRQDSVTLDDAQMAISRGIHVVEWYARRTAS